MHTVRLYVVLYNNNIPCMCLSYIISRVCMHCTLFTSMYICVCRIYVVCMHWCTLFASIVCYICVCRIYVVCTYWCTLFASMLCVTYVCRIYVVCMYWCTFRGMVFQTPSRESNFDTWITSGSSVIWPYSISEKISRTILISFNGYLRWIVAEASPLCEPVDSARHFGHYSKLSIMWYMVHVCHGCITVVSCDRCVTLGYPYHNFASLWYSMNNTNDICITQLEYQGN